MGTHPIFESDFDCLTDFFTSTVCRVRDVNLYSIFFRYVTVR